LSVNGPEVDVRLTKIMISDALIGTFINADQIGILTINDLQMSKDVDKEADLY
jgi:hypothetical protein